MIRKYRKNDVDAVVSSWRLASERAHPFLTTQFLDQEASNVRNIYLVHAETWVIEVGACVVGFIALIDDQIGGLFLEPKYHGQGYGKALVDKAVAEKGSLRVEVFKLNTIGRRFYRSYGFTGNEEFLHPETGQPTLRLSYTLE